MYSQNCTKIEATFPYAWLQEEEIKLQWFLLKLQNIYISPEKGETKNTDHDYFVTEIQLDRGRDWGEIGKGIYRLLQNLLPVWP